MSETFKEDRGCQRLTRRAEDVRGLNRRAEDARKADNVRDSYGWQRKSEACKDGRGC
jgi:hypothetical protein